MTSNKKAGSRFFEIALAIAILTVTAVIMSPHFMGLSSSAQIASLKQMQGVLIASAHNVYAQAMSIGVQGKHHY